MGPCGPNFIAEGSDCGIVTQEVSFSLERVCVKSVVGKALACICGTRQGDGSPLIVWAAIIKDQIHSAVLRVYGHPLEELVSAVVDGISIRADGRAPREPMVSGRTHKNIHITIAVITPRDVKVPACVATTGSCTIRPRIKTNLREAIGAGHSANAEVAGSGGNDAAFLAEACAAVVRDGHHDAVARVPDYVESSIRADDPMEAFQGAVIITRQSGRRVQLDWLGPGLAAVSRACKKQVAGSESELRPSDVDVARVLSGEIGHDPGLVFKWNIRRGLVRYHRGSVGFPGFAAIE